jgi:hypothetical protein
MLILAYYYYYILKIKNDEIKFGQLRKKNRKIEVLK